MNINNYQRLGSTIKILSCLAPNGLPYCVAEVLTIGPSPHSGPGDFRLSTDHRVFPMKQAEDGNGFVVDGMGFERETVVAKPVPDRPPMAPLPPRRLWW